MVCHLAFSLREIADNEKKRSNDIFDPHRVTLHAVAPKTFPIHIRNSDKKRSNYSLFSLEMRLLTELAFRATKSAPSVEKDFDLWCASDGIANGGAHGKIKIFFYLISDSNFSSFFFIFGSVHFQDYHVFFMHNPSPNRCLVFDLDTTLPFPTYFHKYVTETFRSDYAVSEDHHR